MSDVEYSEREKELIETIAKLEQDKTNLTEEIKTVRAKKAEEEPKEEPAEEPQKPATESEQDTEEVVRKVLTEKEENEAKENFEQAKEDIKNVIRELSPDVDKAGLIYKQFEKELNKFNFAGLKTKEQFIERFKEAYRLMDSGSKPDIQKFYPGATDTTNDPRNESKDTLNAAEVKLYTSLGWTKDKFLSQKQKRPAYIASLLKYHS